METISDFMRKNGRKGGKSTFKKYGVAHFSRAGKASAKARRSKQGDGANI